MIEVSVTSEILESALELANNLPNLRGSITNGGGNLVGCIGEVLVKEYLGATQNNTFDYDLTLNEMTYDVKTKSCTSEPKLHYNASVSNFNPNQKCDRYIFVRVERDKYVKNYFTGRAWIMGWIDKKDFLNKANFYNENQSDPFGDGWQFRGSCYNLQYSKLNPIFERKLQE